MKTVYISALKIFTFLTAFLFKNKGTDVVAIFAFHFIGDTVSTIPAVELIKQKFGNDRIYIFCYEGSEAIFKIKYPALNYKTFRSNKIDLGREKFNLKFLRLLKYLRELNPSVVFDITSSFKTSILALLSGANERAGFGNAYLESFFTHFVKRNVDQHVSNYYLNTVKNYFKDFTAVNNKIVSANYNPESRIIINPFAGWRAKEWGLNNFLMLAEVLKKKYNVAVLAEKTLIDNETEIELNRKGINLILSDSISHMIEILRECSLLISNDTGPILVAGLLGKPTFSIYGPTNPLFHKFQGMNQKTYHENIKCSPGVDKKMCFTLGGRVGCPSAECMKFLKFDSVFNEVSLFISDLKLIAKNHNAV